MWRNKISWLNTKYLLKYLKYTLFCTLCKLINNLMIRKINTQWNVVSLRYRCMNIDIYHEVKHPPHVKRPYTLTRFQIPVIWFQWHVHIKNFRQWSLQVAPIHHWAVCTTILLYVSFFCPISLYPSLILIKVSKQHFKSIHAFIASWNYLEMGAIHQIVQGTNTSG